MVMERGRVNGVSSTSGVDDPGDEPDEEQQNSIRNTSSFGNLSANHSIDSVPPPSYPCSEICSECKKQVATPIIEEDDDDAQEALNACPCECHRQLSMQSPSMPPPTHVPPNGPNCLPGCGYSGLPCYNCTSMKNDSQDHEQRTTHYSRPDFPTQIYTVELMNPTTLSSFQSQLQASREHQIIAVQSEDSPQARKRRRTCVSLVVFIIVINVAIAIFRMLGGGSVY